MKHPTTHLAPPPDHGHTPCCGRTVYELPIGDRLTNSAEKVTCGEVGK